MATLSSRDRELLVFEARWPVMDGGKENALRSQLGLSPARYFQLLNTVIENPAAMAVDPHLVKSLLNARRRRAGARSRRAFTL